MLKGNNLSNITLDPKLINDAQDLWMEQATQLSDGSVRILSSRTIWSNKDGSFKPIYPDIAQTKSKNPLLFLQCCEDNNNGYFVLANKGIFWFAADDSSYEPLDFLPSGEYFAILKTDDGKLWVSSSNGILSIDYTNKKIRNRLLLRRFVWRLFRKKSFMCVCKRHSHIWMQTWFCMRQSSIHL